MNTLPNPFETLQTLRYKDKTYFYYSLPQLKKSGKGDPSRLPYSIRILLENLLRHANGEIVTEETILHLLSWSPKKKEEREIPFMPGRVLLQDFTGVPALVDLAAMRDKVKELGEDPEKINPLIPVDLVIDHSVQVDFYGVPEAFKKNVHLEMERNRERYQFLKWGQKALKNFRIVPPGTGICHQVNLEYLSRVVMDKEEKGISLLYPDTLLGTDSHTTMINGLGVLGWGVGGIEAEAVMLGQPYFMVIPQVVGVVLEGRLQEGVTPTDLVLFVTEKLRKVGVVDKFVEFAGPALSYLSIPDRATIANMAPEYGATCGFFPPDETTLQYLRLTGRGQWAEWVERYLKAQDLFLDSTAPPVEFSETVLISLDELKPSLSGPRRPQDRIPLHSAKERFYEELKKTYKVDIKKPYSEPETISQNRYPLYEEFATEIEIQGKKEKITHGSVVIAAITSCTNTSNPTLMIGAGLLAKKANEKGVKVPGYVKVSLAPGSQVVTRYLEKSGLLSELELLGFYLVGYGCTTCIGNSGPLPPEVEKVIKEKKIVACAVLSGNRNFEARIHPLVKANFLASPMLVVAYALAGTVDIHWEKEPVGMDREGKPVYLKDLWPSYTEIQEYIQKFLSPEMFVKQYETVFEGDEFWKNLPAPTQTLFAWDETSTYIRKPPYFESFTLSVPPLTDIESARVLVYVGDSITTDHISPAGNIPIESPAGRYLIEKGVPPREFNSYGSRRGNHEVMIRGTFANVRLVNKLVPDREGGYTLYLGNPSPLRKKNEDILAGRSGEVMTIFSASELYRKENVPTIILAGKEYGSGSSRDWAAKGPALLGVKAVIAESFERIHRSNLVGMGILPLQFMPGENGEKLNLTGRELYTIRGIRDISPRKILTVTATKEDGTFVQFSVTARLDSSIEVQYYQHGGILPFVLRQILKQTV